MPPEVNRNICQNPQEEPLTIQTSGPSTYRVTPYSTCLTQSPDTSCAIE